ncbi:(2Fe-2S)-binding protein [Sulfolobales archaeon HS-7]|nr:(2Fe-2S)-binding protein [Sulfolobales archaeon HS-7]
MTKFNYFVETRFICDTMDASPRPIVKKNDLIFLRRLLHKMRDEKTRFDQKTFVEKGRDYFYDYAERNVGPLDPTRRAFLKGMIIGIGALAVASAVPVIDYLNQPQIYIKSFPWIILVDTDGNPIKASQVQVNNPAIMLFQYPMEGDITFLLNLGDENNNPIKIPPAEVTIPENGAKYHFPGGVGPSNSIVAFSAICQHLGCQPPEIHFYPPTYFAPGGIPPDFLPPNAYQAAKSLGLHSVIHCDCHGSTYAPELGATVVTGPTVRPLPYVKLYWDSSTDFLYATEMNLHAPVILGHNSDLESFAYLSSYNTQTGCPQQLLSANETPSECYSIVRNEGDTFQSG